MRFLAVLNDQLEIGILELVKFVSNAFSTKPESKPGFSDARWSLARSDHRLLLGITMERSMRVF